MTEYDLAEKDSAKPIKINKAPNELSEMAIKQIESERETLSSEIHNNLLQSAFSAMLHLNNVYQKTSEPEHKKRLGLAIKSLDKLLADGRNVLKVLSPPALESDGLLYAIKDQAKNVFESHPISYTIAEQNLKRLPREIEEAISHISREAFMNIIKHSRATKVEIKIGVKRDRYAKVTIKDNGIGVSNPKDRKQGHIGLDLIRKRVEMCNGIVCIDSKPYNGTTIKAIFPLKPAKKARRTYCCYKEKLQQPAIATFLIAFFIVLNYSIIFFLNAADTAWARSFAPNFINIFFQ